MLIFTYSFNTNKLIKQNEDKCDIINMCHENK